MDTSQHKQMLIAFGAGATCALILPKVFFTLLGVAVLLASADAIIKFSHKEC